MHNTFDLGKFIQNARATLVENLAAGVGIDAQKHSIRESGDLLVMMVCAAIANALMNAKNLRGLIPCGQLIADAKEILRFKSYKEGGLNELWVKVLKYSDPGNLPITDFEAILRFCGNPNPEHTFELWRSSLMKSRELWSDTVRQLTEDALADGPIRIFKAQFQIFDAGVGSFNDQMKGTEDILEPSPPRRRARRNRRIDR